MKTVNTLYLEVCDAMLESGGLQTGLWSQQEFLDAFVDILTDFLQRSSLYKKIDAQIQGAGISQYVWDDWCMELQAMFSNEKFLFHGTADDLDSSNQNWMSKVRVPRDWHDDQLPPRTSELFPSPSSNGNQVQTTAVNGFYGTLSAVTAGDIDIQTSAPLYGTIAGNTGRVYVESSGPFYGVMRSVVETKSNVSAITTVSPFNFYPGLATYIEQVHDVWFPAIKCGVLAKLWSKDGDGRNDQNSKFCAERYEEFIRIAKAISLEGLGQEAA